MKRYLEGTVIPNDYEDVFDWMGWPYISPNQVREALNDATEAKEPIEFVISSGGGSVIAGSDIYATLREYQGDVTLRIVYAASAASVIAMARHSIAEPTAMIMIHNSSTSAEGDYREMDRVSEMLKTVNEAMSNAYTLKTGMAKDDILDLMDKETWLTADRALELGFIDEIDKGERKGLAASVNGLPSDAEVKKIRKIMAKAQAMERLAALEAEFKTKEDIK